MRRLRPALEFLSAYFIRAGAMRWAERPVSIGRLST